MTPPPLILMVAITTDLIDRNARPTAICTTAYAEQIAAAGGHPVLIPPIPSLAQRVASRFDAFVFTGGDDPATEPFDAPTHPRADLVRPERQAFETALLRQLNENHPDKPVLGVCLGMQMMALVAGGCLDQYLPESTPDADRHWDADHPIEPRPDCDWLTAGVVHSRHKQAVASPGSLSVAATSDDGLVEAIHDPTRPFYRGVQWHPERTDNPALGANLFADLMTRRQA